MPKYIGVSPWALAARVDAVPAAEFVRLTAAQARIIRDSKPGADIVAVLVAHDRGGPGRLAKRWYDWYARRDDVTACAAATPNMRARAAGG